MPLSKMTHKSEDGPVDRLGRIAAVMMEAGERHPEYRETDKAIVMLDDPTEDRGMIVPGGWEKDEMTDAFLSLLAHVQVLAEANGMRLDFVPNPNPPGQG